MKGLARHLVPAALAAASTYAGAPAAGPLAQRLDPATATTPTAAVAADGALWVAWVDGKHVYVASSKDLGQTLSKPVPVNPEPESIDANGEARPKVATGPNGEVYVSYTRRLDKPYTGDIRFSRRLSEGRFSPPVTVNDDGLHTGHRFDLLTVGPRGDVHLFWIDKRDLDAAAAAGKPYEGAALYTAVSTDGGRTFSRNRKVKDHICECCRLAVAWDGATPVLFWRDLMAGDVRDHALARLAATPQIVRATDDGWKIAGCPHHGPSIAVGEGGTLHLAWFTGEGQRGAGAFYRRSMDGGRTFSTPVRLGGTGAGRSQVLARGRDVWVVWKEGDRQGGAVIRGMRSRDAGATWSDTADLSRTTGESDHPQLVAKGDSVLLCWFTKDEGFRATRLPI